MDNTQVALFTGGIALLVLVFTLAGWRNKILLFALGIVSFALIILALAWSSVKVAAPKFAATLDAAAATRATYLAMPILCLAGVVYAFLRRNAVVDASDTRETPDELQEGVYTARIDVDASKLASDHMLEISIIAFNGTRATINFSSMTGSVSTSVPIQTDDGITAKIALDLPAPVMRRTSAAQFAPRSEFCLVLEQVFRPAMAQQFLDAMLAGPVELDLTKLQIVLSADSEPVTLRVWNLNLQRAERLWTCKIVSSVGLATTKPVPSLK